MAERTVPHNLEAERAILGSVLLDDAALNTVVDRISRDDFYSEAHRIIFDKMLALSEVGTAIDFVTLTQALGPAGLLDKSGGVVYLTALTDGVPIGSASAIQDYCRIVEQASTSRKLINLGNNLVARSMEGGEDPDTMLDEFQQSIFSVSQGRVQTGFQAVRQIFTQSFGQIDALFERGQRVTGIETGLEDLDNMTCGLQPGDLILVAARPSLGKTALALNIASHAAIHNEKKVGVLSLEMSKEALVLRLLCAEARIDSHKLRTGFSSRDDWMRMTPALGRISAAPLYIDDSAALTISQIRAKARRMKAEVGLDLLIIDYLQLISTQGRFENRNQEITYVSRSLKAIAKELHIPVVALSQLSRAPEQRRGRSQRPQLSDLRESGSLEQDSDVVIFIYREKDKDAEGEDPWKTYLIIGKQRNGPTGDVPVVFLRPFAKFENQVHETWEAPDERTPYSED